MDWKDIREEKPEIDTEVLCEDHYQSIHFCIFRGVNFEVVTYGNADSIHYGFDRIMYWTPVTLREP